jgi:DNA-binding MarR family transcriptional regulator
MERTEETDGVWLHCSNSAVRRAARRLGQLYGDVLGTGDVNSTQFTLLSQIARSGGPTLKALAGAMVMDLSALGHTLKPLVRDGLIELVADRRDKRVKRARLTKAGAARQAELMQRWRDAQARFDRVLGAERSAELRRTLAFVSSSEFAEAFDRAGDGAPQV